MEEIWKDIEGYEGLYQVSNLARVRSLDRIVNVGKFKRQVYGILMKPGIDKKFYYQLQLTDKLGISKNYKVHRLVAIAFIPNPNNYPQVLHRDETLPIEEAHKVNNLYWGTQKDNINDCVNKGRFNKTFGEGKPNSKLKEEEAKKIIDYIDQDFSNKDILRLVPNASISMIGNIKRGDSWKYLKK